MSSYGDTTNAYLLQLAGETSPAPLTAAALDSADEEIDEAFSSGGYATPLVLTSLADPSKSRLTNKLKTVSNAIAGFILSTPTNATGKRGAPEKVAKDAADARAWLKMVATRQIIITPLVTAGLSSISQTGMQVVGDNTWAANAALFDLVQLPLD